MGKGRFGLQKLLASSGRGFWLSSGSVHIVLTASAVVLWIWGGKFCVLLKGSAEVSAGRKMYDKP